MSKQIGISLLPNLKEKINRVEIIPVEIDGEAFEVQLNMFLSTALKNKLIENIQAVSLEQHVEKYGAETIAFYAIFKTITDIGFPEDIESAMELFSGLSDLGIIEKVVESVPEKMFNDITETLEMTKDLLEKMADFANN